MAKKLKEVLEYLYYKLYQAALKSSLKDIPDYVASFWISGLLGVNIIIINAFLAKTTSVPWGFSHPKNGGWIIGIIILLSLLYFNKNRRNIILAKYSKENKQKRIMGNVIVSFYVGMTFLLIFAVAFYKPWNS